MAQKLNLTDKDKHAILQAFQSTLKNAIAGKRISFNYDVGTITVPKEQYPTIKFTNIAYLKIKALVDQAPGEVGWLGTVTKKNKVYTIEDILLYPQTVTSSTVDVNEKHYLEWSLKQNINKLRFQAHSHVNFSTSPSGVDNTLYEKYLQQLDENDFFIFMIFNKKNEFSCILYDKQTNLQYGTKEINYVFGNIPDYTNWAKKQLNEYCTKPVTKVYPVNYTPSTSSYANKVAAITEEEYRAYLRGEY